MYLNCKIGKTFSADPNSRMTWSAVISQTRILHLHMSQQSRYVSQSVAQYGITLRCKTAQNGTSSLTYSHYQKIPVTDIVHFSHS